MQGYAGQTVDEILSFEGTEGVPFLMSTLEEAIQEKMKADGPGKLTGVERPKL